MFIFLVFLFVFSFPPPDSLPLDRPNFALCFSSPAANYALSSLFGGIFVKLWPQSKGMAHPKCAFGLPGVIVSNSGGLCPKHTHTHTHRFRSLSLSLFLWESSRGILVVFLKAGTLKRARFGSRAVV